MSTMPAYFPESAEQSSSPELSDELIMTLDAGWCDASEKTPYSGFSDATLKTKKRWRQKKTQGTPCLTIHTSSTSAQQEEPVPVSSDMRKLTSSLVFSDASKKAMHSGFPDASLKTKEQ
ncbi:hypothetical protein ABG768_021642 [Culter alburnus]|uniref:Uncharacterized protein n=1 Tax=Culter alburnus TaxID=194366 RepID=A0AAW2ASI5_CULAL